MQTKFPTSPATIVITRRGGREEVWIGDVVTWEPESTPPIVLINHARSEERYFSLDTLIDTAPNLWTGTIWGSNGGPITVRPTVEGDAVNAITMDGMPRVPMPIEVIADLHANNGGVFVEPKLYAMTEDDGFVSTMMLNAGSGLYVRYSSAWHRLTDEDVVDGLTVVEVPDSALDMFDQFDRAGQMVSITAMPTVEEDPMTTVDTGTSGPTPEVAPTTAAGLVMDVPLISGPENVERAIAAAVENPDLQWYVSRRVKAMGLDIELPWE